MSLSTCICLLAIIQHSLTSTSLSLFINIIVSEDGKNYNASYDFDNEIFKNEAKKAVEKSLEGVVWKPGTLNGKAVASSLKLPISMTFQ